MINHTDGNNNPEIQCRFGDAIRELGICRLLKESSIRKKKGGSVYEIFQFLLLLVFQNCNLFHFLNSKKQDMAFSKNTHYRFLNEPRYNWQRFLTLLSARVAAYKPVSGISDACFSWAGMVDFSWEQFLTRNHLGGPDAWA